MTKGRPLLKRAGQNVTGSGIVSRTGQGWREGQGWTGVAGRAVMDNAEPGRIVQGQFGYG